MNRTLLFLIFTLPFAGCTQKETVERYPGGEPKRVNEYAWPGAHDSLHLRRSQDFTLDGNPAYDVHYRKGILHGKFQAFGNNGQIREEGNFREGKREGEWIFYFNRFTPSAKGSYRNGLKHGIWTEYWEDNNLRRRGEFRDGHEIGEWVSWSAMGSEIEHNSCFSENSRGRFRSFYENGSPKEEYPCTRGKRNGAYAEHDAQGNILRRGFYDSTGAQDSLWESFHAGEKPASRRHYHSGLLEDSVLAWDDAGRISEKGFFRAGTGVLTRYDTLGGKSQLIDYRNGIPLTFHRWHPNGKTASEGTFAEGKKTGLWKDWDVQGKLRESSNYENGMLHGERRFFDSTGTLTRVQKYFRGYPSEGWFPKLPGRMKKTGK